MGKERIAQALQAGDEKWCQSDTFNIDAAPLYSEQLMAEAPGIYEFDKRLERLMDEEVLNNIIFPDVPPDKLPYVGVLLGVNRSLTAAFLTSLVRLNFFSEGHSQPMKSRRRDVWNRIFTGKGIRYHHKELVITEGQRGILVKETEGARHQPDYFDPFHYMLTAGYPREKLFGITTWRHPLYLADSWSRMGDWEFGDDPEYINRAHRVAYEAMMQALKNRIPIVPVVAELMLAENGPARVMRALVGKLKEVVGPEIEYTPRAIDWSNGQAYERLITHYQLPPDSYVEGVVARCQKNLGRFGLRYKPRRREELSLSLEEQEALLNQLDEALEIYKEALVRSREMLNLE